MKSILHFFPSLLLLFFQPQWAHAQARMDSIAGKGDSLEVEKKIPKKSYFQAGLSYVSDNVDLGRKDSEVIHYYTPTLGYYHKSGLHVQVSLGYLVSPVESRVDMTTLEGGYSFSIGEYDGEFTASKYYFSGQSTNINAEIKGSLAYSSGYDFGFIRPSLDATLNISSKLDYAMGFGIEHSFNAWDDALEITPKVLANASTQNFYNDYYRKRRYSIKRKGQKPITGVATITGDAVNPGAFNILDYEGSLAINYTVGKFIFNITPTYAIPVNPSAINITKTLQSGAIINKTQTEKLSNYFYWTLGAQFNF